MGKKVKVTTKCGGEFFYDYDQEVESVEIIREPNNLIITRQENMGKTGHWHFEDEHGGWAGNLFVNGTKITIHYSASRGVQVELVKV